MLFGLIGAFGSWLLKAISCVCIAFLLAIILLGIYNLIVIKIENHNHDLKKALKARNIMLNNLIKRKR